MIMGMFQTEIALDATDMDNKGRNYSSKFAASSSPKSLKELSLLSVVQSFSSITSGDA